MLVLNEQSDKLSVRAGKHCEWTLAKVCDVTSNAVIAEHIPLYRGREGGVERGREGEWERGWREGEWGWREGERERGMERGRVGVERGREGEGDGERERVGVETGDRESEEERGRCPCVLTRRW